MKYIVTLFWSMMISFLITYVLNSMANDPFVLSQALGIGAMIFIVILVLSAILGDPKKSEQ